MAEVEGRALAEVVADGEVAQRQQAAAAIVQQAQALTICDEASLNRALAMLSQCRGEIKAVDALRRRFVDPLNDHVKDINRFFADNVAPLKEADGIIVTKSSTYRRDVQAPAKTVTTDNGATVTFVERWSFEITAPKDVPRDLCCPDEKKIGQMVRAKVWQPEEAPAGIRITVNREPTVRG